MYMLLKMCFCLSFPISFQAGWKLPAKWESWFVLIFDILHPNLCSIDVGLSSVGETQWLFCSLRTINGAQQILVKWMKETVNEWVFFSPSLHALEWLAKHLFHGSLGVGKGLADGYCSWMLQGSHLGQVSVDESFLQLGLHRFLDRISLRLTQVTDLMTLKNVWSLWKQWCTTLRGENWNCADKELLKIKTNTRKCLIPPNFESQRSCPY